MGIGIDESMDYLINNILETSEKCKDDIGKNPIEKNKKKKKIKKKKFLMKN